MIVTIYESKDRCCQAITYGLQKVAGMISRILILPGLKNKGITSEIISNPGSNLHHIRRKLNKTIFINDLLPGLSKLKYAALAGGDYVLHITGLRLTLDSFIIASCVTWKDRNKKA